MWTTGNIIVALCYAPVVIYVFVVPFYPIRWRVNCPKIEIPLKVEQSSDEMYDYCLGQHAHSMHLQTLEIGLRSRHAESIGIIMFFVAGFTMAFGSLVPAAFFLLPIGFHVYQAYLQDLVIRRYELEQEQWKAACLRIVSFLNEIPFTLDQILSYRSNRQGWRAWLPIF